ncbi:Heavy-metal resistance protein CzcE [Massilia sp. PDC64]|nr:CzcE family metal-binding protein [Massilia sp. PDC64]SDE95388.1 Heavy-metal resistance protein CzcE [Massilia sp. PDC64]
MTPLTRTLALSILALAAFATGTAGATPRPSMPMDFGRVVMSDVADRDVTVDASTRWVNVTNGQTVRFTVGGQRFTFVFDAWPTTDSIPLSAIAPKGVTVPDVRVYIAPNPLYQD